MHTTPVQVTQRLGIWALLPRPLFWQCPFISSVVFYTALIDNVPSHSHLASPGKRRSDRQGTHTHTHSLRHSSIIKPGCCSSFVFPEDRPSPLYQVSAWEKRNEPRLPPTTDTVSGFLQWSLSLSLCWQFDRHALDTLIWWYAYLVKYTLLWLWLFCFFVPKILMFFGSLTPSTSNMKDWKKNKHLAHSRADPWSSWASNYMSGICLLSRIVRNAPRHPRYSTIQYLSFWRDRITHKWISVIIYSTPGWWKVGWSLKAHKTILEPHSKKKK